MTTNKNWIDEFDKEFIRPGIVEGTTWWKEEWDDSGSPDIDKIKSFIQNIIDTIHKDLIEIVGENMEKYFSNNK